MSKRAVLKSVQIVGISLGLAFLAANTLFAAAFLDRVYPGVAVGEIDLSGLNRRQARQVLRDRLKDYRIVIRADKRREAATPDQLGVEYDLDATIDVAFSRGRDRLVPLWGLRESHSSTDLRYAYKVDRMRLSSYVARIAGENAVAAKDATVEITEGRAVIKSDQNGVGIDQPKLSELIEGAVRDQELNVNIELTSLPAEIKADEVVQNLQEAERLMAAKVELSYQDRVFSPDAEVIGRWLVFTKEAGGLKTVIDSVRVKDYVKSLAKTLDVAPKNHLINVLNGAVQGEEPGKEGLAVDQDKLASQLAEVLSGGVVKLAVPMRTLPFKTVYNRSINLDFGRYIEINLSLQRLWVYEDHKTVYESPITSGAAGAGFPTVTGLFDVYSKARNRNLNGYAIGYNYNVFVQYWMPFYKDFGMHDASWRSAFGGPDYYYGGSHGCVNMPLETAAWIYNWADVGTPVWVHS